MKLVRQRIVLVSIKKPAKASLNEELQWFGSSLGLFELRDRDKSRFRVFIELLKAAKAEAPVSSDQLAHSLGLSRGTIVHHISALMESGIVVQDGRRYILRDDNLEHLIEELKKDFERAYESLKKAANEIDVVLGL